MQDSVEQQEFEKYIKEEFDKMLREYDGLRTILEKQVHMKPSVEKKLNEAAWDLYLTDECVCDCEKAYGKLCKHPDEYKNGGCK